MGIAVIGGLACGGALTLFVIPAMYVLLRGGERQAVSAGASSHDAAIEPVMLAVPRPLGP